MNCKKYLELISPYIDGELEVLDRAILEEHIADCHSCREEFEILQEITNDIKKIEMIDLPKGFHEDLMEKIRLENKQEQEKVIPLPLNKKKWYQNLKVASAVAAVFIFSTILLDPLNMKVPKESITEIEDNVTRFHMVLEPGVESLEDSSVEEAMPIDFPADSPAKVPEVDPINLPADTPDIASVNPSTDSSKNQPASWPVDPVDSPADLELDQQAEAQTNPKVRSTPRTHQEPSIQGAAFSGHEISPEIWLISTQKYKEYKEAIISIAKDMGLEITIVEEIELKESGAQSITLEITLEKDKKARFESKIKEIDKEANFVIQQQNEEQEENRDLTTLMMIINQIE